MLPRRAPHRAAWFALPAMSLLLAACHARAPAGNLPRRVDLLAESAWAEVRANAVDLELLLSRPLLLHEGLDRAGSSVWTARWARAAMLQVPLSDARDRELRFVARSHDSEPAIRVLVSWNGEPLETVALTPVESQHKLALPAAVLRPGKNELAFEPLGVHDRQHILGVFGLEVAPPGAPRPLAIPAPVEGGFWLPEGASLGLPLHEEPPASLRLAARAPGPAARLSASLAGRRVLELALPAGGSRDAAGELSVRPGVFERLEIVSHGPGGALVSMLELRTAERARPRPAPLPVRPNLVIVVGDALRADYLGVYGHPGDISPRLDAFARQAVVFEEAWAQSSWTRPAIATLFTGLTPQAHGIDGARKALSSAVPTLAETLKGAGYRTGAFVANDVLSARLGYGRGFDDWRLKKVPARQVVEGALAWSEAGPAPFLLYVHTLEPHRPYQPDLEHWEPFLPAGMRPANTKPLASRCPDLTGEEMALLRSAYQGEVRQNDAAFGALLDGLSARRFLDNTVVVFTADHGEAFGEHESCGHSATLYREVLRVPLVVRVPGVAGRREAIVAQQADLMPTLLSLVGVPSPEPLEGRDLSALMLHRTPLAPSGVPLMSHLRTYARAHKEAARLGRFKLVLNRERHLRAPRLELFDVPNDPAELHNIAERESVATDYLLGQLQSLRDAEGQLKQRRQMGQEVELTPEEKEALRALGYVQ